MGPNYGDEIDCSSFFDHIDDLIEFPLDNDCGDGCQECKNFPDMWTDVLPENDPIINGSHLHSASDLSAELSVPHEDIVQLEWLSTFMEDSFSGGGMTIGKDSLYTNKISSTISELESSSSSSSSCSGGAGKTMQLSPTHRGPHRARSKRPRPATFNPRPAIHLISPSSSTIEAPNMLHMLSPESDNIVESPPMKKFPKPSTKPSGDEHKKKKIKITFPSPDSNIVASSNPPPVRKCLHCEITKTPQWRAGPLGPKTLCNACGVRYKSGRLFPEYRPAASPTFIPSLHSNSHKKVVEMRAKIVCGTPPSGPKPNLAP